MNKAVGKKPDGTPLLVLILEPGNLHRLKLKQPISLRVEDMFPDGIPRRLELVIDFDETPLATAKKLSSEAEVAVDERSLVAPKQPHCPECRSTIEQLGVWRNESPMALTFCSVCGCVFGMVPSEIARDLKPA